MKLFCPDLLSGKYLPVRCMNRSLIGGQSFSPALSWSEVPQEAKSLVLWLRDQSAPEGAQVLWCIINMVPEARDIQERASGIRDRLPKGAMELRNAHNELAYDGPTVRLFEEPHTILFRLQALSKEKLELGPFAPESERDALIAKFVIDEATLQAFALRTQ